VTVFHEDTDSFFSKLIQRGDPILLEDLTIQVIIGSNTDYEMQQEDDYEVLYDGNPTAIVSPFLRLFTNLANLEVLLTWAGALTTEEPNYDQKSWSSSGEMEQVQGCPYSTLLAHHNFLQCFRLSMCRHILDLPIDASSNIWRSIIPQENQLKDKHNLIQVIVDNNVSYPSLSSSFSVRRECEVITCNRNRRVLHNHRRSCILIAFVRANCTSEIKDSILALIPDILSFVQC
jgi:hypothetical protein